MTMSIGNLNKGSAMKPFEKKKVAIFGGGGYLGGMIFGFLQRCSSLYGTGISSINSTPKVISACGISAKELNLILGTKFVLAQADESFIKLTNMKDLESIENRVNGMDAVIIGTKYTLETVAQLHHIDYAQADKVTTDNFFTLFHKAKRTANVNAA